MEEEQTFSDHTILRKMNKKKPKQQPARVPPKSIALRKVPGAYPPQNLNVADNAPIYEKWEAHLANNPVRCSRKRRQTVRSPPPDYSKEGEDLWSFDAEMKKFHTQVAQNVIKDKTELRVLTGIITDHLNKVDKTLRENDPGHIVGAGYTSDSHKSRSLTWAKNIKGKDIDLDVHAYKLSCAFNLAWSHIEPLLHPDVKADFEEARQRLGGLSMDAGARNPDGAPRYKIIIDGKQVEFEKKARAPATGVYGMNYSRHPYNEKYFNKWVIILNLARTRDESHGGNFDVAEYALMVPQRGNQMIAYRCEDIHGTSLLNVDPLDKNPEFKQIGLAFLLPKSLKTELASEISHGDTPEPRTEIGLEDPMLLGDEEVQPKPRAAMPLIKPTKKRDGTRVYEIDMKKVFDLPVEHAYKTMTSAALREECAKRVREGDMDKRAYATSWNKDQIIAALLKNDGIEVPFSRVARKVAAVEDVEMRDVSNDGEGIRSKIYDDGDDDVD